MPPSRVLIVFLQTVVFRFQTASVSPILPSESLEKLLLRDVATGSTLVDSRMMNFWSTDANKGSLDSPKDALENGHADHVQSLNWESFCCWLSLISANFSECRRRKLSSLSSQRGSDFRGQDFGGRVRTLQMNCLLNCKQFC